MPTTNKQLAALFQDMSDLLKLSEENPFKIRAYDRAVQVFTELPRDAGSLSRDELLEIDGVGQGIADKVGEFVKSGRIKEHEALKVRFPAGVLEIMRLPGLGPKRAALLFRELRVDSAEKLGKLAASGRLRTIAGFGEKMEQNILKGIAFSREASKRIHRRAAAAIASQILEELRPAPGLLRLEAAGSFRRLKETVGDLDFLCAGRGPGGIISRFTKMPGVERVLAAGGTKASVVLREGLQCDLRVVEPASWGAALLYFTGSKDHNVRLRELALKRGYTVNEYGLFRLKDARKTRPVAGRTEEEIYKALGLDFIPPELREDRGEIQAAETGRLPRLVERRDIRGDFHNHTRLTDGAHSHEQMAEAARKQGWEWVFIGDHSQSLKVAGGLSPAELRAKIEKIRRLNKTFGDLEVLCGMEVDILADGRMDYDDGTLAGIDCVVASVHSLFKQPEARMTARIRKAMDNPHVDIIGHLTGRLLGRREPYAVGVEEILRAAAETRTALEINGQPDRLELEDVHARSARDLKVPLALATDAHSTEQFDNMESAVAVARRAWIEPRHLLNCLSLKEIKEWLA